MRKLFYIILLLMICSCSGCVDFNFPLETNPTTNIETAKTVIDELKAINQLQVTEVLVIDEEVYFNKTSHYQFDSNFYGYSKLSGYKDVVSKSIYNYNSELCVLSKEKNFYDVSVPQSILQYLGVDEILNNASNKPIIKGSVTGEIDIEKAPQVITNLFYDLENEAFITNLNKSLKLEYNIAIEEGEIYYLNLDLTNVFKMIDDKIQSSKKMYLFSEFDSFDFPEMPEKDNILDDPSTKPEDNLQEVNELKIEGLNYIDNIFKNLNSINDDIELIKVYPKSGKITYSYEISDNSIIDNNGTFIRPDEDTEINIKIHLYYNNERYNTLSYDIICLGKPTVSGAYGTITNPLYQGSSDVSTLDVYFIEMSQQYGDAIYIKAGDFDMLIDAGQPSDGANVKNFLSQYVTDQTLECVIATHAHSDHIGGILTAFQAVKNINYVVDYGYSRASYSAANQYNSYIKANADHYYAVYDAVRNQNGALKTVYITEEIYIDFLDTNQYLKPGVDIGGSDNNEASVTLMFHYYGKQFYFSGDLDSGGESYLVSTKQVGDIDVMKATHHASSTGNSKKLLNVIKPEYVIISTALVDRGSLSANAKTQPHPNATALSNFYSVNAKVYCNFTNGTIKVSVKDGEISVTGLGSRNGYYMDSKLIKNENNFEFKDTAWSKKYR